MPAISANIIAHRGHGPLLHSDAPRGVYSFGALFLVKS